MNNVIDLAKERRIAALINSIAAKSERNPEHGVRTNAMLNGKLPPMNELPTSIRIPEPLIRRLDVLADRFNSDPVRSLERRFKRSDAVHEVRWSRFVGQDMTGLKWVSVVKLPAGWAAN